MEQIQRRIDTYFASATAYWDQVYSEDGLVGRIYQARQQAAFRWVQQLQLPAGARIADIGCGVGGTAVLLAQLGHNVVAVDRVPAMLRLADENANRAGVSSRVQTALCDVCALDLPAAEFDVTIALGLLPWVNRPRDALAEMVRITRPGGHLIISADNAWRLNHILDPLDNPIIAPLRRATAKALRIARLLRSNAGVDVRIQSPLAFTRFAESAGLTIVDSRSIGFGPFTALRKKLFSESAGLRINSYFQKLADRKIPVLSKTGVHYLVLAEKNARTSAYQTWLKQ